MRSGGWGTRKSIAKSPSTARLDGHPRSRKLDYPLAALGPQNKFFGGYGFRWHFWQGLWYRWLVDREIGKMKISGK